MNTYYIQYYTVIHMSHTCYFVVPAVVLEPGTGNNFSIYSLGMKLDRLGYTARPKA